MLAGDEKSLIRHSSASQERTVPMGVGRAHPDRAFGGRPVIWILTDRRYVRQRMPLAVSRWLARRGVAARLVVADEGQRVSRLAPLDEPGDRSVWHGLRPGDLVLARTRHVLGLALLKEAEARDARSVNPWTALIKVRNKVRATLALARVGLPVPPTYLAHVPGDLRRIPAARFPLILKPFQGDNCGGIQIVRSPQDLQSVRWGDPLVLAQPYLDTGGVELKVYVAGEALWVTRRSSPLARRTEAPLPVALTPALADLARGCREIFRLPLLGLDVLETPEGLVIVDVNDFPNYTGLEEAPAAIGRLLLEKAGAADGPAERVPRVAPEAPGR
jgi:ribosomal protein S6--L-glutamate ligase